MQRYDVLSRRGVLALAAALLLPAAAEAQDSFGSLKRLSILIGSGPGSTADQTGRAFAAAAQNLLPGRQIDVENQAGAGGLQTLNSILATTTPDPVLGLIDGSQVYNVLRGGSQAATRFASLKLIGSMGVDRRALFVTVRSGVKSFKELMDTGRSIVVPTVSAINGAHIETLLINALTGTHLKPVGGYSSPDRKLALMSGEAEGVVGSIDTFADLVASNVLLPVLRLNDAGPDAPFAAAPTLRSYATGPDADLLVTLIENVAHADRIMIAPNALPAEQVKALEQLFDAITGNPDFGKGASFALSQVTPGNHAEIQQRVGSLLAQQGLGDVLARALTCGGSLSSGQTCV